MIDNEPTEKKSGVSALVIGIVVLLCCICVLVIGIGGYGLYAFSQIAPTTDIFVPTPFIEEGTTPTGGAELFRPPADTISTETIQTLDKSIVPENDVYKLDKFIIETLKSEKEVLKKLITDKKIFKNHFSVSKDGIATQAHVYQLPP